DGSITRDVTAAEERRRRGRWPRQQDGAAAAGADEDEAPLPGARRRRRGYYYLHHPQARRRRRRGHYPRARRRPAGDSVRGGASGRWWPNALPRHGREEHRRGRRPGWRPDGRVRYGGGRADVRVTPPGPSLLLRRRPGRRRRGRWPRRRRGALRADVARRAHAGVVRGAVVGARPLRIAVVVAVLLLLLAGAPLLLVLEERGGGTYSFDTERRKWRRHGDWVLPFRGQGYFDGELDAWVGLHREVHGRVCACQVASRGGARPPEYRETLDYDSVSSSRSKNRRQRATLTYMGDGMFCAVETCETPPTSSSSSEGGGGGGGVEVHVTVFGLKYNRRGELQARVRRAAGAFPLPKQHVPSFSPVAFWM
ncbi:Os12g0624400, partial [Oryza sativa Japonica Group]